MALTRGLMEQDGIFKLFDPDMKEADLKAGLTVAINSGSSIAWYKTSTVDGGSGLLLDNGIYANPVGTPEATWAYKSDNFTCVSSESYQIDASSDTVDVTLPPLSVGDPFVFHNLITSTFKVQILNPTETIKGKGGDIAAGVNMELEPGQSVQLVAKSSTILSITGALV